MCRFNAGILMNLTALLIILLVLGVIVGNIMLIKYSAKFNLKNVNQDPIEKAKQQFENQKQSKKNTTDSDKL